MSNLNAAITPSYYFLHVLTGFGGFDPMPKRMMALWTHVALTQIRDRHNFLVEDEVKKTKEGIKDKEGDEKEDKKADKGGTETVNIGWDSFYIGHAASCKLYIYPKAALYLYDHTVVNNLI